METVDYGDFINNGGKVIKWTCGSAYSGGFVAKANYNAIYKELADCGGVYDLIGFMGTYGIGYIDSELDDETQVKIAEIEEKLEDHPIYDENVESELEIEAREERTAELKRDAINKYGEFLSEADIDAIFNSADCSDYLWNNMAEDGAESMYIDEDKFFETFFPSKTER